MERRYFVYSSGIPTEAVADVIFLPVVSRVINAEVLHALAQRQEFFCWLFCGIDLTKDVCQVGGCVGGTTQGDFPGHI